MGLGGFKYFFSNFLSRRRELRRADRVGLDGRPGEPRRQLPFRPETGQVPVAVEPVKRGQQVDLADGADL